VPKRIFIVDDGKTIRQSSRTYLETRLEPIVYAKATDGLDAIQRAKEIGPELIFLDFSMPIFNGLEGVADLYGMQPRVPIILHIAQRHRSREAGPSRLYSRGGLQDGSNRCLAASSSKFRRCRNSRNRVIWGAPCFRLLLLGGEFPPGALLRSQRARTNATKKSVN
jgi:CheY-like chemotaxis protein